MLAQTQNGWNCETSQWGFHYDNRPSFCDGCGGKAVLPNMWKLANSKYPADRPIIAHGESVTLKQIEAAVACLYEKQKTIAEGAGACGLAAAMFGQKALQGRYSALS